MGPHEQRGGERFFLQFIMKLIAQLPHASLFEVEHLKMNYDSRTI